MLITWLCCRKNLPLPFLPWSEYLRVVFGNGFVSGSKHKGVSFKRNCGAASVGEYNKVNKCYQLSWYHRLATEKSLKADVSSISPSSEQWRNILCRRFWCMLRKRLLCWEKTDRCLGKRKQTYPIINLSVSNFIWRRQNSTKKEQTDRTQKKYHCFSYFSKMNFFRVYMASLIQEVTQSNACMTFESSIKAAFIKYIAKIIYSTNDD